MLVDAVSLWYISTLLRLKIERISRQQARRFILWLESPIYVWLVCDACAKLPLSYPETSLTTPRLLSSKRSRRLYRNHQPFQSSGSSPNFLIRLGRSGRSGLSWKPGLKNQISSLTLFRPGYFCFLRSIWTQVVFEVILRHYDVILLNLLAVYKFHHFFSPGRRTW